MIKGYCPNCINPIIINKDDVYLQSEILHQCGHCDKYILIEIKAELIKEENKI